MAASAPSANGSNPPSGHSKDHSGSNHTAPAPSPDSPPASRYACSRWPPASGTTTSPANPPEPSPPTDAKSHQPSRGRQGNDVGSDYRSEIFYASAEQRRVAEETIGDVDASGLWPGKVVTAISAAGPFWEAEPGHQVSPQRCPRGYTCHFPRREWKLPHREHVA